MDPEEALDNVIYSRAYNSEHQMDLITLLAARFAEEQGRYKLLIVDSIISLFRTDYSGRWVAGRAHAPRHVRVPTPGASLASASKSSTRCSLG